MGHIEDVLQTMAVPVRGLRVWKQKGLCSIRADTIRYDAFEPVEAAVVPAHPPRPPGVFVTHLYAVFFVLVFRMWHLTLVLLLIF